MFQTQYLAKLASDQNVAVRKELFQTAASWLLELSEKKQHEVRLLPYVLSALIDTNPELQTVGFNLMEEIGLQYVHDPMYEKENEAEVKDMKQYLPENIKDIVQVPQRNMLLPLKRTVSFPFHFYFCLGSFCVGRPCLGSRIMVKSCIGILLHAINADLQAWTSEPKQLAAKFLHVILVYAEDNATMHLQPLIVMMVQACNDPLIESRVLNSAMLLGFFVDPSAYLQILLPRISGEVGDSSMHAGNTLKVLASLLHGSLPIKFADHVPNICSILTEQHLMFDGVHDLNLSSQTQGFVKDFLLSCMKCGEPLLEPSSLMMESLSSRWPSECLVVSSS